MSSNVTKKYNNKNNEYTFQSINYGFLKKLNYIFLTMRMRDKSKRKIERYRKRNCKYVRKVYNLFYF